MLRTVSPGVGRHWRVAAIALLVTQGVVTLALAWDIQWHRTIGGDNFLILPHLLLSAGIGVVGCLSLALVLGDSPRYRKM